MVKATKGRQKIQMEKMKNESNLQVTFSKRRTGLFKKASELSTLCGVDIAVIVFSPGGKAYSFGHPSVEAITDRFLSNNNPQPQQLPSSTMQLIEASRNNTVRELNFQLTQVTEQLELQKMHGEQLNKALEASGIGRPTVDQMSLLQLQEFRLQLQNLKMKIAKQAEETSLQNLNQQLLYTPSLPQLQQQQPWSSLPTQLQFQSGPVQPPRPPLSTSVLPQYYWGNLASCSNNVNNVTPQRSQVVDTRNDEYNPGMIMQPRMMNYGSGIGSSSGLGGLNL